MLSNDHINSHNKKVRTNSPIFYCISFSGVPPFDKVLYPRTGATIAAINALKDKFDAVYDVTIMYDRNRSAAPSMIGNRDRQNCTALYRADAHAYATSRGARSYAL